MSTSKDKNSKELEQVSSGFEEMVEYMSDEIHAAGDGNEDSVSTLESMSDDFQLESDENGTKITITKHLQ